jgi:hypothetical protein
MAEYTSSSMTREEASKAEPPKEQEVMAAPEQEVEEEILQPEPEQMETPPQSGGLMSRG